LLLARFDKETDKVNDKDGARNVQSPGLATYLMLVNRRLGKKICRGLKKRDREFLPGLSDFGRLGRSTA
jgi:hypothetical protein